MDIADFFQSVRLTLNRWFTGDEIIESAARSELLILAVIIFLLGLCIGLLCRKKQPLLISSFVAPSAAITTNTKSEVFAQLLLIETKLVLQSYQQAYGEAIEKPATDNALRLDFSMKSDCLQIYATGIEDLKQLNNNSLRLKIVKANTLFKLQINSIQHYQKKYREYQSLLSTVLASDKPIDNNRVAKARLQLKSQSSQLQQQHWLMCEQMQQMLSMLRSYQKDRN